MGRRKSEDSRSTGNKESIGSKSLGSSIKSRKNTRKSDKDLLTQKSNTKRIQKAKTTKKLKTVEKPLRSINDFKQLCQPKEQLKVQQNANVCIQLSKDSKPTLFECYKDQSIFSGSHLDLIIDKNLDDDVQSDEEVVKSGIKMCIRDLKNTKNLKECHIEISMKLN